MMVRGPTSSTLEFQIDSRSLADSEHIIISREFSIVYGLFILIWSNLLRAVVQVGDDFYHIDDAIVKNASEIFDEEPSKLLNVYAWKKK